MDFPNITAIKHLSKIIAKNLSTQPEKIDTNLFVIFLLIITNDSLDIFADDAFTPSRIQRQKERERKMCKRICC